MDKVTKESLQEEHKNLLNAVRDDDTAFIGLLDTISNFHKYPLSAQLTFFYHAPKGTRTIASREIWERAYGTSIVGNADAIPMLGENGQVSYVYDVRDTVGFLQGDERLYHIPWTYDETRDENALRLAFKAEDNVSIDDALRAHIQNKVINSNYPSHVASAVEYIVRQRLGLATDDTSLRSMDRENIPSEQMLSEISQTARDILDDIQMNIVNERKEQNVREARERLRNVGRSSEELPEAGEARDVETDRRGGGDRDLSQGVRGESVGESRTSDGTTQEEDASDGRTEEEGRNGLHPEDESGSADRNGIDAGRNQGLKELPTLSGLSSEDAENAFRGYVEGINNAVASGTIDIDAARGYYRDGVMLIVSGEGSFTPEKRDELTVLVVDTLKDTYDRQQRPADDQQEEEPEQTVEKHPENEPEPVEADVEPEKEPEQTVEKHPETEPEPAEPTFAMGSSIYDWYHSAHPTDDAAESIHRDITFQDVLDHLESGEDFYAYTGVSESDIRESIFTELSSLSGRSYDELYQLYLNANNVQTVEQDNESAPETKTYKYYLLHRPVSMGTQPDDFVHFADDDAIRQEQNMLTDAFRRNIMGIVYYDHPLTEQQINEYELIDASIVKKRMELVRSYYETQQEVPSWIKDFTFQELYDALENGTDYPTFLGLANDNDVPAPYYGKIIAADYMAYGKELANRMNVNSHYIFQLMAQNYVKETVNALRFMRKSNQEQEAREEDRESTTETKQNSIDYANMAVSPAFSSTLNGLQSVFSSEATMSSIMNQFDWMMTDHLYLALGLLHHEHPELRERIAEYLTELNYHGEVKYLEKGEYDAYFNSMDTINQYLAQHPLNVAIQDEAISQAAQNVMALVAKDEAWRTNPPFDTTPYLQAKERIREQLDSENWLEYREAIEQKVRQADQITEIALMLNYIEQPRLRNKVLMCEGADSSLYKNLVDGAYEDYLAFFHIALHAAEETKEEPEIQPEIKTEEAAPAKTAEQERTPDGNRIDLSTLDLTADLSTVSGRRAVFLRNIAAIQIVHDLEKTNRQPTEQELAVLRSYAGFGALPDVFDPNASSWRREYRMAKDNLTETEYASAKESTLSAFYTPKEVIDGIYEGLEAGGITGGINILDPSTGSGRFLSDMPDSVKSNSHLFGVELDELSSKIAKYANPDADITKSPFEDTTFPDNAFDLAISNVPFGNFPINDSRYSGHNYMIHEYFINRMIDEVRPGGIVVAITSKGTMDKVNNAARKDFARKAELIKGIRLPEEVFNGAGTNTVSDILIFRKREKELGPDDELPEWVNSSNRSFDGYPILYHVNDYFYNHPENVKGFLRVKSSSIGDTVTVMSEDYNGQSLKDIISDSIRDAGVFFQMDLQSKCNSS